LALFVAVQKSALAAAAIGTNPNMTLIAATGAKPAASHFHFKHPYAEDHALSLNERGD
jgi:hypothetical protein